MQSRDAEDRQPLFDRLKQGLEEGIAYVKGDARLLAGIRVALAKARELGYPVEQMVVSVSVAEGLCSVHFTPQPDPTTLTTGGNLSLTVDPDSEEVTRIERGQ